MRTARLFGPAVFFVVFLALAGPPDARSQAAPGAALEGPWRGDIETPGQQIGVIFHLQRGAGGALTATLDVPQQGASGIPVSNVRATEDSLRLEVARIGGVFTGVFRDGGKTAAGTWRQGGGAFPLVLTKGDAGESEAGEEGRERPPEGPGISGRWIGPVTFPGGQTLRVVFNIEEAPNGTLTATAESPDQGGDPFPISAIERTGDRLNVEIEAVGASFEGQIGEGEQVIEGTFRQGGASLPLTLRRAEGAEETGTEQAARRPQEPEPPFPYEAEDVRFPGGTGGVTLAGTLTLPEGEAKEEISSGNGPHPAVVLVSGSGPQNRDEALAGHKPFLVLADYLTRRGIAVLRYDDRGVAGSTGDFGQATTHDFASDARAALGYLRERGDLNLGKIGLIGHSEGGLVGPMVAAHHAEALDFLVLLAGPGVPGDELLARQNALLFERSGMSAEGAAAYERRMKAALGRLDAVPPGEPLPEHVRTALRADFRAAAEAMSSADRAVYGPTDSTAFAQVLDRMTRQLATPWMRSFLASDPRPALRQVRVPVLALFGEKDFQVAPEQNAPALREVLEENPDATVKVLPDLNHLFQTAATGLPGEYAQIEETFAPKVLDVIGEWIIERTRAGRE